MARLAGLREIARHVTWIRRSLEIFQVTRDACCAGQRVVVIYVAIGTLARWNGMRARERESCRGMVELAVGPQHRVVALFASVRKSRMRNRRSGPREIFLMARNTGRAGQVVIVVHVAVAALAWRNRMCATQRESNRTVIELGIQPIISGMAGLALNRELARHVARIAGSLVIRCMTRIAFGRHRLELAGGNPFVTGIAIHSGVRAGQRETIIVLLDLLYRYLPATNRVALLAICS